MTARAPFLDFRNVNSLWASVAVETLARVGVTHAVISPGSRSTPLTIQLARHPRIEAIPVLDERSAAFFALGLARRMQRPVVLLCTSGTAGSNYYPAVIEAKESGVPLLVITADRPPEMRECRSGQTIDQQKLFGSHVNHYHELAAPGLNVGLLRYVRQTLAHAAERSLWPVPGPVHLNIPFRDPLPPIADGTGVADFEGKINEGEFFGSLEVLAPAAASSTTHLPPRIPRGARGIIVAGQARPGDPAAYAKAVGTMARRLGWPVLADALSPLRNYRRSVPGLVTSYDVMARSETLRHALSPSHVICLHDWPTSKTLRQWISEADPLVTFVSLHPQNPDALHARSRIARSDVASFAAAIKATPAPRAWVERWRGTDAVVNRRLGKALGASAPNFEGRVAAELPAALPPNSTVFVANSMPVRDLEYFWPANDRAHVVHCNRGANGIDGTLSTALGVAHGGSPTVLVAGDLAFLHDANGLLIAPKFRGSLTVVLINNSGGGIFDHLPVARFDPPFEEFFATPQQVDFAQLCAAHAVKHRIVRGIAELRRALAVPLRQGIRVLELRTDRKQDAAFRKELFSRLV